MLAEAHQMNTKFMIIKALESRDRNGDPQLNVT